MFGLSGVTVSATFDADGLRGTVRHFAPGRRRRGTPSLTPYSIERPARVLIADMALQRAGLAAALAEDAALEVCAEADDAEGAIIEAGRTRPHVCLVGWDIPGGGLTAVEGIYFAAPGSAVVVLGGSSDIDDLLSALRAGAVGYVPAGVSSAGLRRAVHAVLGDEAAVPRSMVRDLILELRSQAPAHSGVTRRESQVLDMLRQGQATEQIARRLRISPVTVRRHISELMHKLGVENRAALIGGSPPTHAA
jgi:two-component system nitrate/nitrite response regulator NarL